MRVSLFQVAVTASVVAHLAIAALWPRLSHSEHERPPVKLSMRAQWWLVPSEMMMPLPTTKSSFGSPSPSMSLVEATRFTVPAPPVSAAPRVAPPSPANGSS